MQVYDLIMLIVLGMSTIFGVIKGFAWQVASLASIIVSYIVAYRYRGQVAEMIDAQPPWNMILAMLILYMGTGFVIGVGFRLMSSAIDKIRLKEFDRHLGALFGLGKGLVFCLLITMFAMTLLGPQQQAAICQSRSGYYISAFLDKAVVLLPQEVHATIGEYLAKLDSQLKQGQHANGLNGTEGLSNQSVTLPNLDLWPTGNSGSGGWPVSQNGNPQPSGFPSLNSGAQAGSQLPSGLRPANNLQPSGGAVFPQ